MKYVAFDTETFKINQRGKATTKRVPRLVCMSVDEEGEDPALYERARAVHIFSALIDRDDVVLAGHAVSFDVLVMMRAVYEDTGRDMSHRIKELYEEGRIVDTGIREQLYDNAVTGMGVRGGYDLKAVAKRTSGIKLTGKKGEDSWRLRYNELDGIPAEEYPKAAYDYAINDAIATLAVARAREPQPNESFQNCFGYAVALAGSWGMQTDTPFAEAIDGWYARVEDDARTELERGEIIVDGVVKRAKKQTLVAKAFSHYGEKPPLTPTGKFISTKAEVLKGLMERGYREPLFDALMRYNRATKLRATYLQPVLDAGDEPLCPRYNTFVATGRSSCRSPNVQNFPSRLSPIEQLALAWFEAQHGKMTIYERLTHPEGFAVGRDIRGVFVPRPGRVFISADYAAIEMAALAQVMRNWTGEITPLGRSINAGEDQHIRVLAEWIGSSYDEALAWYESGDPEAEFKRFCCKSMNYSAPTGSLPETWRGTLSTFGVYITLAEAEKVYGAWNSAWTEMNEFRARVARGRTPDGSYIVEQHGPDRAVAGWRRRIAEKQTEASNSYFQGLTADGAKLAGWMLMEACYYDTDSPLYEARTVVFEHDSYTLEIDADRAEAGCAELTRLMVAGMKRFIPDIRVEAEAEIMEDRWRK